MSDNKLRCALVYRLEAGTTTTLAKYDHAGQYESGGVGSLGDSRDQTFAEACAKVIESDPPSGLSEAGSLGGYKVVSSDEHQVIYGADADGVCVGVITGLDYPSRVGITMCQELYEALSEKFASQLKSGGTDSLTKKAKTILKQKCEKYDDLTQVDKASKLLNSVDVVKSQMQSNIAGMLKNTEQAESLAEKSDQLNEQASVFKKKSGDLRKQMAWKNLKMTLILGGIIIVILIVILAPLINAAKS